MLRDEILESAEFLLLANDFEHCESGAPVLSLKTNFATASVVFPGHRLQDGVLEGHTTHAHTLPPAGNAALLGDSETGIVTDLLDALAEAIGGMGVKWFANQIEGKILNALASEFDFFKSDEVKEMERYVQKVIETNDIQTANRQLRQVLAWLPNVYEKSKYKSPADEFGDLAPQLDTLENDVLPKVVPYLAGMPVYTVAANTALLLCQRMDALKQATPKFPLYAPRYIPVVTQMLRDTVEARASFVSLESHDFGSSVSYYDRITGLSGSQFSFPFWRPTAKNTEQVALQAEYTKLQYLQATVIPDLLSKYDSCVKSVEAWCKQTNQPTPKFGISNVLNSVTDDYSNCHRS